MKTNRIARRGFTLVELLVVIVIIAALAGLTAPQVIRMKKKGDLAEATSNARQIGLALADFDSDIGGYPDGLAEGTVKAIESMTGQASTRVLTGSTSNPFFRQLIEADIAKSEQPFYAKTTYTRKPDDITRGVEALKAREVGFGYIMQSDGNSIGPAAGRPIVAAPLKARSTDGSMETDPYDGKAIVLFTDSSVRQLNIRKNDSKAIMSGKHMLESGSDDTVWGTELRPTIMPPDTGN